MNCPLTSKRSAEVHSITFRRFETVDIRLHEGEECAHLIRRAIRLDCKFDDVLSLAEQDEDGRDK